MSGFVFLAAAMVAIALASVLWPLLRPGRGASVERRAANASIFRDQFADLDADLARGAITADKHAEARAELERRVLEEVPAAPERAALHPQRWTAAIVLVVLPVAAALLYMQLGEPEALRAPAPTAAAKSQFTEQQINDMVAQLAERLKNEPTNAEGWGILGRSYYVMGRYADAAAAFERLAALRPDDANVLVDRADALAMSSNREIAGPTLVLVERALKLNPAQPKALAMAGTAAFDRADYAAAVGYWERLQGTQPPGSEIAQAIQASINEARQRGKLPAPSAATSARPAPQASVARASVAGTVTLSPTLAARAAPTDTVFVYARAADGGRMPLAILRAQVKDLPLTFTLDDSLSMSPAAKLSAARQVIVTARISRSGSATPQSGDLEAVTAPVALGASDLKLVIERAVP